MLQAVTMRQQTDGDLTVARSRPLLRVGDNNQAQYFWLNKGRQGNLQTAVEMANLVRQTAIQDRGLELFAVEVLQRAGLDSHSDQADIVDTLFRFTQTIPYFYDPAGAFDSIHTARETLKIGKGDCDDLSILLASMLAVVGLQPSFVLARYKDDTEGFDHIYVSVEVNGERVPLDPSSRSRGYGWESPAALEKVDFPIFGGKVQGDTNGANGDFKGLGSPATTNLAITGATIGVSFIPVVGPFLAALVAPIAGLFNRSAQRAEETQRDEWKDQLLAALDDVRRAVDSCQITREQGDAIAQQYKEKFYQGCASFTKSSVTQSCHNFETQDYPGGPQQGAIVTHIDRIKAAGGNCRVQNQGVQIASGSETASVNAGSNQAAGLTLGGNGSLSALLLLLGGGVLLLKAVKG